MSAMNHKEMIARIDTLLKEAESLVLAKVVETTAGDARSDERWLIRPDGRVEGAPAAGDFKKFLARGARAALEKKETETVPFNEGDLEKRIVFVPLPAPDHLVIAGGGHIAVPLTDMAAQAGFRVTVVDDREEFAAAENFPRAKEVRTAPFAEALGALRGGPSTYVVIITRGHLYDRESLEAVVDKPLAYVGMIGSRRRVKAVLGLLSGQGVAPEKLRSLHSPIGLDIGALTPAEIAVSIVAELVAVRRRGTSPLSLSRRGEAP